MVSCCMLVAVGLRVVSDESFLHTFPSEISFTGKTTVLTFIVFLAVSTTGALNLTPLTHVALLSVTDFISN